MKITKNNNLNHLLTPKSQPLTASDVAMGFFTGHISDYDRESCQMIHDYMSLPELRKKWQKTPENLTSRAWSLRQNFPEMKATYDNNMPAFLYFLNLDKELCEKFVFSGINDIEDDIAEKISELKEITESELTEMLADIFVLPDFVQKEVAYLSSINFQNIKKIYNNIITKKDKKSFAKVKKSFKMQTGDVVKYEEKIVVKNNDSDSKYPKPHPKYGRSFTALNEYYHQIANLLDKRKKEIEVVKIFVKKSEETIGDIIKFHKKHNTLSIITGNEENVELIADEMVEKSIYLWKKMTCRKNQLSKQDISDGLRASSKTAIKRQLRAIGRQGQVDLASALGLVSDRRNSMCHPIVAKHKIQMAKKAKKWALSVEVRPMSGGDDGNGITLWDVINCKKKQELASLFAITKAFEEEGEAEGLACFFGTLTLPGAFHPAPKSHGCQRNPEWTYANNNATASRETLSENWSLLRARIKKIRSFHGMFGLKVVEFHKDGCPHLHFMIWLPRTYNDYQKHETLQTADFLKKHINDVAPGCGHDLQIIEKTDENSASPSSYIMKYIIKGLETQDPDDMLVDDDNTKYRAMLSATRTRSFSFIGSRGIRTLWNRLYKSNEKEIAGWSEEWQEIATHVLLSKEEWNNIKTVEDLEEQEKSKENSRFHARQALRLLNAFPHYQQSYKIRTTYETVQNKFLEDVQKPCGFELENYLGEVHCIPLKTVDVDLLPVIGKDNVDKTGILKNQMRKEILERMNPVLNEMTYSDVCSLQGIYSEQLQDIYFLIISKTNEITDDYNKEQVSLILTNPSSKPSACSTDVDLDEVIPENTTEYIQARTALDLLRRYLT